MNLALPQYMFNKERRGNIDYTIPQLYPDICFIVNVWDVPIYTNPRRYNGRIGITSPYKNSESPILSAQNSAVAQI